MKTLRALILAYWPLFWAFPYVWDRKCLKAARQAGRRVWRGGSTP